MKSQVSLGLVSELFLLCLKPVARIKEMQNLSENKERLEEKDHLKKKIYHLNVKHKKSLFQGEWKIDGKSVILVQEILF
jgi:hypothetical protein